MKNILQKDKLHEYYIMVPNVSIIDQECNGWAMALSAIDCNIKGRVALKLLRGYFNPHKCWTLLKILYGLDNIAC